MSRIRRHKSITPTLLSGMIMLAGAAAIWWAMVWVAWKVWN